MPTIDGNYWYDLNAYHKVTFVDLDDAVEGYDQCLDLIMSQPRWVLDNLDHIKEFEVPWLNYSGREKCAEDGRIYAASRPYDPK